LAAFPGVHLDKTLTAQETLCDFEQQNFTESVAYIFISTFAED